MPQIQFTDRFSVRITRRTKNALRCDNKCVKR